MDQASTDVFAHWQLHLPELAHAIDASLPAQETVPRPLIEIPSNSREIFSALFGDDFNARICEENRFGRKELRGEQIRIKFLEDMIKTGV